MGITDHDRERLWAQAASACSICRNELLAPADHPHDREALVGDEAYIVSPSLDGPRANTAVPGMDFDAYDNRILLCKFDHRIVDELPDMIRAETLHELKSKHERWVRRRLHIVSDESIGLRPKFPGRGMVLSRLRRGKDAWHVVTGSSFYMLDSVDEYEASPESREVADGFLMRLRHYGKIHDFLTDRGFEAIREAQQDLREGLDELANLGLVAFGAQREMLVTDGGKTPTPATMAIVVIRPRNEIGEDERLPLAFPVQEPLVLLKSVSFSVEKLRQISRPN